MKKPLNQYTVRVVKQQTGEVTIDAESEYDVQLKLDVMDDDDIQWSDREWPDIDIELWKEGKWSLILIVPEVLNHLKTMMEHPATDNYVKLLHDGLKEAWTEFLNNPKAADMLRAQEDQYGPFEPKEEA